MIVFLLQTPPNSTQSAPAPAAKPNALGVTLKSGHGNAKVVTKSETNEVNGKGVAVATVNSTAAEPATTGTSSAGRRKRTVAIV